MIVADKLEQNQKEFPAGSIIPANGFLVIITDDTLDSGFGLSSSGEEVWLEDTTGTVIDNVTFLAMADTQSYSRIPDGNSNWQLTDYITKDLQTLLLVLMIWEILY